LSLSLDTIPCYKTFEDCPQLLLHSLPSRPCRCACQQRVYRFRWGFVY